jgi:hypothetical protein
MRTFKQFYEKTVIGLIEEMDIAGIGKVEAKVDSGNGAYNVLHGGDLTIQGGKVSFTTINGKRLIKDIVDTITINVGAGHTEERPVVGFRIKFAGIEFDNVPFSIGNREANEYKVLVGKDFIKQLDALIDVNSKNIADDQIDVHYDTNQETV